MFNREEKKQMREIEKQISEASMKYKRVFGTDDGKWVLEDLAKRSFDRISTYDEDEKKMCINEGRRSLYKHITTMVDKDLSDILSALTKE